MSAEQAAVVGDNGEFIIGLSSRKLDDIINNKMRDLIFEPPASAYEALSPANQRALVHLTKAANILDSVFLKQDHPDNIRAKAALEEAAGKGNELAGKALKVFTMNNGVEGLDVYGKKTRPLRVFKDKKLGAGKGFYPQNLTEKGLASYLVKHPEQASAILSNNTVVLRDEFNASALVAVPYSVAFRDEMNGAARELLAAARETDHDGLAKYLRWQAQALVNDSDPEMLFNADKHWINLEDSPLEFTIARENYQDVMSSNVAADPKVAAVLSENGIKAKAKDSIGVRVGIVNQDSYALIKNYKEGLMGFASRMPLTDQYEQQTDSQMTFVDVDLVALTGDYAAVRGGITLAQNLPNDDKLAVQLQQGSRLVFHRQVRQGKDLAQDTKFLERLIDPSQRHLFDDNADFLFTVGHELVHSLGPGATKDGRDKKGSLGRFGAILEENKADVGSLYMASYLVETGKITQEEANKIYLTWAAGDLPKKRPSEEEAHRFRSIMQHNYFVEKGAIIFEKGRQLSVVPEKMADVAREMLQEVIQLQLDGDPAKAEAFVHRYGAWNEALQYAADEQMSLKPKLYRLIDQPMRNSLLQQTLS